MTAALSLAALTNAYLALKLPTQSAEDDEFAREIIEKVRDSQPSASDLKRDAERLKERMKIEKPKF